jgi:hypothetical protein
LFVAFVSFSANLQCNNTLLKHSAHEFWPIGRTEVVQYHLQRSHTKRFYPNAARQQRWEQRSIATQQQNQEKFPTPEAIQPAQKHKWRVIAQDTCAQIWFMSTDETHEHGTYVHAANLASWR